MGDAPEPSLSNRLHPLWLGIALLLAAAGAAADKHTYALDEDPIRLGSKALVAGRLDEARAEFSRAVAAEYQIHRAWFGLAEVAVREGRYADAEPLYRDAVDARRGTREGYPEASAGLGLLLLRLGRTLEADLEFDRALAADDDLWRAVYGKARVLLLSDKPREARRLLERGADREGLAEGEDLYHHGMALYHLADGDLDGAEREALLALHLDPDDPAHGELVGRIYERRDEPALAINAYEQVLLAPGRVPTPPGLHALGRLYQKVGRYNEARDHYLRAVAADSTYAPALKDLAGLLRLADRHEQAARVLLRYVTLAPRELDILLDLADSCYEIGRYAQGLEAARAARALAPDRTETGFALARCGIHVRDAEARDEAAALMGALPDSLVWRPSDLVALASWFRERGRYDEAEARLERALAMDADAAGAHFERGLVELKRNRPRAAAAALERAADLDPDSPVTFINLGIARFQAGDYLAAAPEFRRALDLDAGLTVARLLLAQAYAVSDSLAAAEEQYTLVLEAEPDNARALRGLGFCHVRRARYAEAAGYYGRATEVAPEDADGWAGLGNAHLGQSDFTAARAAFERARALDPDNATMRKGFELLEEAESADG